MSIEGKIRIELCCREQRIRQVRIHSSRPLQLPLLFAGKPVEKVLQTIPMLYSICATAQARAAAIACRQALGVSVDPPIELAETMLVWFETAREHIWRVLIDWSGYLGEEVDHQQLPGLSLLIPDAKKALFDNTATAFTLKPVVKPEVETITRLIKRLSQRLERSVFGIPASDWYAMTSLEALESWIATKQTGAARYLNQLLESGMAELGQSGIEALPEIDDGQLHQYMQQADAFITCPEWQERPHETSSLTRQARHPLIKEMMPVYGKGLLTRLTARLLELASIPDRLMELMYGITQETEALVSVSNASASATGLGVVEAARGRLVHRASVMDNAIKHYQILAPTEWNFHPKGLVAEGLLGLPSGGESAMREQASLFINAIDPCVGYSFEFV
jgi:coenzyme F420-reducing hydrogenase alpha subunit